MSLICFPQLNRIPWIQWVFCCQSDLFTYGNADSSLDNYNTMGDDVDKSSAAGAST